jgi:hypothetical protein
MTSKRVTANDLVERVLQLTRSMHALRSLRGLPFSNIAVNGCRISCAARRSLSDGRDPLSGPLALSGLSAHLRLLSRGRWAAER